MQKNNTFADYIRTQDILFKHAKGMRDVIGLEFHPLHEIFLFAAGDAEFICDSFRATLVPNTLVIIPKESFHTFVVHGAEEDYHRYVFNFSDVSGLDALIAERMKTVCLFPAADTVCAQFARLGAHVEEEPSRRALRLKAVFTEILLDMEAPETTSGTAVQTSMHPLVTEAVRYISKNARRIEKVEDIAAAVNVSASYLSHLFRRELHISPHRYILEQKLILANRKIESGYSAGQAAAESGFGNYSGFYKMYKKMFGYPPSGARTGGI